jgi:hypothetical protein
MREIEREIEGLQRSKEKERSGEGRADRGGSDQGVVTRGLTTMEPEEDNLAWVPGNPCDS